MMQSIQVDFQILHPEAALAYNICMSYYQSTLTKRIAAACIYKYKLFTFVFLSRHSNQRLCSGRKHNALEQIYMTSFYQKLQAKTKKIMELDVENSYSTISTVPP